MADMSFLDKLTPEQEAVANMIADRAISMGIDPRLAVSLAYRESQFNPNAKGSSGEIGVMQVMPATGKGMGFNEKDLADPAKNIDAGLTYLKQQLDAFKDPVAAVAAYNAGPNHAFFKDPDNKELPASTMQYLADIKNLGGFTVTPKAEPPPEPEPEKPKKPVEVSDFDMKRATVDALAALGGAGIGGTAGGAKAVFNRMFPPPGSGVEKWAQQVAGGFRGGDTYEKAYELQSGQRKGAKIAGQQPTFKVAKPPVQAPTLPQQIANVAPKAPVIGGALGGLGAAEMGMQAMQRYRSQDPIGAGIAGVGALGSAAAMIPSVPTRVIGGGLAVASPAALYLLDKMRAARQQPPQGMPQMSGLNAP